MNLIRKMILWMYYDVYEVLMQNGGVCSVESVLGSVGDMLKSRSREMITKLKQNIQLFHIHFFSLFFIEFEYKFEIFFQ